MIPRSPQDQFTVTWWEVDGTRVVRWDATYYKYMLWSDYSPDSPGGTNLFDDWMLEENGRPACRLPGWENMQEMLDDESRNIYETELEALTALRSRLMKRKKSLEDQLEREVERLNENRKRIQEIP